MKAINALLILFLLALATGAFLLGKYRLDLVKQILRQDQKLFENFPSKDASYIELGLADQKLVFERTDNIWYSQNASQSADSKYIETFLETIKSLPRNILVSENPAKAKVFGVDQSGLQIIIKNSSQKISHLFIGKRGQNNNSNFYRKDGENNVYQSDKLLDTIFIPMPQSP